MYHTGCMTNFWPETGQKQAAISTFSSKRRGRRCNDFLFWVRSNHLVYITILMIQRGIQWRECLFEIHTHSFTNSPKLWVFTALIHYPAQWALWHLGTCCRPSIYETYLPSLLLYLSWVNRLSAENPYLWPLRWPIQISFSMVICRFRLKKLFKERFVCVCVMNTWNSEIALF